MTAVAFVDITIKMDSPRKSSIGNCDYEDVYKHSFFIKSPPIHLFTNQTSWKKRYFILSKTGKNGCVLRYLKGHQLKGSIEINEASEVEIGISDTEKMSTVKKMFKCQPTEVMTIRTENRTFYLIGTDSKHIEDWATFLFAACRGIEKPELRSRSYSLPAAATTEDGLCPSNEYEELETAASKKRPASYPTPQVSCEEKHIYDSPRKLLLRLRHLTNAPLEEPLEENCKTENIYVYPRRVLAQSDDFLAEVSIMEQSSSSDELKLKSNNEYMSMKELLLGVTEEDIQSACKKNESLTLPESQKKSSNTQVPEDKPMKPMPLLRTSKPEKNSKISSLSVVQLSIILSKITDDDQLEDVNIIFPRGDFVNCLTLLEASGHICISQWNDQHHLGCIFHQGDYIMAVNDLHVKSIDEISLFTSRSTRKEVKVTIRRIPDSNILHAKGCKCS
ncbi:pleckstrin homology domain-containing family S member 1 isoform X2 [Pogona vitticeps]